MNLQDYKIWETPTPSDIKVIKREEQPLFAKYKDKTIALSHGDNFINWQYFCL